MKKIFVLLLALLLVFGMISCGSATETEETQPHENETETAVETEAEAEKETEKESSKATEKETEKEIEPVIPVGAYSKTEGFENANDVFKQYSTSGYQALISPANEYKMGGQYDNPALKVGAKAGKAHSGEKSMYLEGFAPTDSGAYSARVKLNNLVPADLNGYIGQSFTFSAYVMVENIAGTAPSDSVAIRCGFMGDKAYTELVTKTFQVKAGEWTLVECELEITEDFLRNDLGEIQGKHYPLRPFLGLGSASCYAVNVYVDDIVIQSKKGVGVTMPSIFADNMVLQRGKEVPVWGWGAVPGETVTATIAGYSAKDTVDRNGEFCVVLPAMKGSYSETLTITTSSGGSKSFKNVGIGEVWYCSGQSNMQLTVGRTHNNETIVSGADKYDVRSFKMNLTAQYKLQRDVKGGEWKRITSSNVTSVSAIAYITAYQLQAETNVPVAVIECFNGGSAAQAWLSYETIFANDRNNIYNNHDWIPSTTNSSGCEGRTIWEDYDYYWSVGEIYKTSKKEGTLIEGSKGSIGNRFAPTGMYNGMQGPLAGYALAGVLWYQGEARANSLKPDQYNYILFDLIEQWRRDFRDEDLPVVIFQLAPYSDYYNLVRQVQLDTAKRMNNVYAITTAYEGAVMSKASGGVCLDLDRSMSNGWGNSIHPGTKIPVANRAAYTLLTNVYGMVDKYGALCNPEYMSMTVNGNVATLTFSNANGLKIRDGDSKLTGFRAYNAGGKELTIQALEIKGQTVVLTTAKGTKPSKITYAFDVDSVKREISHESLVKEGFEKQYITVMTGNLENAAGQPAIPFLASLSEASIYDAHISGNELVAEIRDVGHTESTHRVVIEILKGTTKLSSVEHTAQFATAGNCVLTQKIDSSATSAKICLYEGDVMIETRVVPIQ